MRSIALCDRFLAACHATPEGLAELKQEVSLVMTAQVRSAAPRTDKPSSATPSASGQKAATPPSSQRRVSSAASSEIDYSLPRELLENKGFTRVVAGGFPRIAQLQDEIQAGDMRKQAANKQAFFARTRQLLDGQMAELDQKRAAAVERRRQEASKLSADIRQHRQDELARHVAHLQRQAVTRDELAGQVAEVHASRQAEMDEVRS